MKELPRSARVFVFAVVVIGAALLAQLLRTAEAPRSMSVLLLLGAFTILGELRPLRAPLGDEGIELTVSTAFGFAILLDFGAAAAATAFVAAVVISDVRSRKAWWKVAFNAAQYVITVVVAGAANSLVLGQPRFPNVAPFASARDIVAATVAAAMFFCVNVALLGIAMALAQGIAVQRLFREDFGYQLVSNMALLALSPIAVVVAEQNTWLLPLLLIPLGAAYHSTVVSLAKQHQAVHDSLTGLPNRSLFRLRAVQALESRSPTGCTALMLIDLDRFKEVNDTLGHHMGDLLLQELGPRLRNVLQDGGMIARLGGDEFGVLLPRVADREEAVVIAKRILESIRKPIHLDDLELELSASVGISFSPDHGDDADALIQRADVAMYWAKDAGAGYAVYSPDLDQNSPMRLALAGELRRAIEDGQLELHFQPLVDVATGLAQGIEALVRWNHPTRGLVPPDDFIPVAEQTGLIRDLTLWVLREALTECRELHECGYELRVSVNVSARILHDKELQWTVASLLASTGVDPSNLMLEITESSVMVDPERSLEAMRRLRSIGVQFALDDYGTGYSSLAYIKNLPLSELKIDKSFITNMAHNPSSALIASSTIDLAHRLGMVSVAEGVEDAATWQRLATMGCELAQGYFFSRPLRGEHLLVWLERNRSSAIPLAADAASVSQLSAVAVAVAAATSGM